MNDILKYYVKSLALSTLTLKKKSILLEKPWALIDDDGEIQKLIFKRDKSLILSKNGKVTEGSWDYYPEAKALLINRVKDKLLLNEQFIDNNVLILKKDGTENDFFALANENTVPDYNIPKYLNSLKYKEFKISEKKLLNGNILQIYNGVKINYPPLLQNHKVEQIDNHYNAIDLPDGDYMSENKKFTFHIKNGNIASVGVNIIKELKNGNFIEIENGNNLATFSNINKKITFNGEPLPDTRLIDKNNFIFEIKESKIAQILIVKEYKLKNGLKIKIEQKNYNKITRWDKVIYAESGFPLADGKYKIKGKFKKIHVLNNFII